MSETDGIVYILDDEPEMVKALTRLLRARRFDVLGFTAVRAFLEASAFVKSFQSIEWRHCVPLGAQNRRRGEAHLRGQAEAAAPSRRRLLPMVQGSLTTTSMRALLRFSSTTPRICSSLSL